MECLSEQCFSGISHSTWKLLVLFEHQHYHCVLLFFKWPKDEELKYMGEGGEGRGEGGGHHQFFQNIGMIRRHE